MIPKVTISPTERKKIADKMMRVASERTEAELKLAGQDMVDTVTRYVQTRYQRREGDRRKEGSTHHLDEAFVYKITRGSGPNGFPFTVELTLRDDISEDDAKKVGALNWPNNGTYEIKPRPPKTRLKWTDADGIVQVPSSVRWKRQGTTGLARGRFMQDARDVVVRRLRNKKL